MVLAVAVEQVLLVAQEPQRQAAMVERVQPHQ
jgi:hypothetical protein